ncbi:MAG: DUF4258 domain-containing protein [Candidatus Woesebacteria bacterium]|nr:MAG: DUF4258 domain-containing protein [Candidatus Woesebacteria bacterium]
MDNHFGGVIWTNHSLDRLRERGIKQGDAWATWRRPDQSYKGNLHKGDDAWRYYRQFDDQRIEVVAKQNEKKEWIILSVWSQRVSRNSPDSRFQIQDSKVSFWRKLYNFIFTK